MQFPTAQTMQGLGPPPWATFTAMSGQPSGVGNPQTFQLGSVDPNGMIVGALTPGYVRLAPNTPQSSLLPGTSIHNSAPYGSANQTLGYTLQQSVEASLTGRQLNNTNLQPSYQLPTFPIQNGSTSQSLPFSHPSIPYGQSGLPYFHPLVPSLCNGGLGAAVQHCSTVNNQTSLLPGAEPFRFLDSLKQFSAFPSEQRRAKPMTTSRTNLYISGLSESDTDETVRCLVKDVVQPKSCKAVVCNGICKGYGFIDCASEEDAEKAIAHILEYARVSGRKLLVKFAYENEKDALNVYVKHLPLDYTKDNLKNLFREYGQITSVKLLEKESGPTGDGFVRYMYAYEAAKAIEELNAKMLVLGNNASPLLCKLADKANARRRGLTTPSTTTTAAQPSLTSNLFQPTPVPLANPTPIRTLASGNTVTGTSMYRGPTLTHLTQQPSSQYASSLSLAASQLHPVQLMLHNMQCGVGSTQIRNILSPGGITNGSSSIAPSIFNQSSSPVTSIASIHPSIMSNRTGTPLMGPPPNTVSVSSSTTPSVTQPPCGSDITGSVEEHTIENANHSTLPCSTTPSSSSPSSVDSVTPKQFDKITEPEYQPPIATDDSQSVFQITDAAQPIFGMTSNLGPVTHTLTNLHIEDQTDISTETNEHTSSQPTVFDSISPNRQPDQHSAQHPATVNQAADSKSPTLTNNTVEVVIQTLNIVSAGEKDSHAVSAMKQAEHTKNTDRHSTVDNISRKANLKTDSCNNLSGPSEDSDTMDGPNPTHVSQKYQQNCVSVVPRQQQPTAAAMNHDRPPNRDFLTNDDKLEQNHHHTNSMRRRRVKQVNTSISGSNISSTQCDQ